MATSPRRLSNSIEEEENPLQRDARRSRILRTENRPQHRRHCRQRMAMHNHTVRLQPDTILSNFFFVFLLVVHEICGFTLCFCVWCCHFSTFFLRGLFQYGDLHCGHCFGCMVLFCHMCPHLRHLSVGNGGMSFVSIIFNL